MTRLKIVAALALCASLVAVMGHDAAGVTPPPEVAADCTVDVTDALNAFLAAQPDGTTIDLGTGCYLTEGTVLIAGKADVTVTGGTLRALTTGAHMAPFDGKAVHWPRHRAHLIVADSTHVTVRGLRVEGPNAAWVYDSNLEAQHGVSVVRSTGVLVDGVTVRDVWGDCAYTSGRSTFVTFRGLDCAGAGRMGVGITDADDVTLAASTFDRVRRSCVDIEPLAATFQEVHRVTITGNLFTYCGNTTVGSGGSGVRDNLTIVDNRSIGPWWSKFGGGGGRTGLTFTGNASDAEATVAPLNVTGWSGVTVRGNTLPTRAEACNKGGCSGGVWAQFVAVTNLRLGANTVGAGELTLTP